MMHVARALLQETWDAWGEQQGFVWASGLGKEEYLELIEVRWAGHPSRVA